MNRLHSRAKLKLATVASVAALAHFVGLTDVALRLGRAAATVSPPPVPFNFPAADQTGTIHVEAPDGIRHATTLNAAIQDRLTGFLSDHHDGTAAIVVVDIKSGKILAMAQGARPETWGGRSHSALHAGFPAASLFKTVVTAAAFEVADLDAAKPLGLSGGCAHVRESGEWLKERDSRRSDNMSLRKAYGLSCNGFFAKVAINYLGLGIINDFAKKFGWDGQIPNDFGLEKSPLLSPEAQSSSTSTVGRYAAGFGRVGVSAAHAAWMMTVIANGGTRKALKLWRDQPEVDTTNMEPIFSQRTAARLLDVMDATVRGGTASFAFRRGKHRALRELVGGKTGTLTGTSPKGLTTWFAGLAPLSDPEIAVASVVVLSERWRIKAPQLAAEGILAYFEERDARVKAQKAKEEAPFMAVKDERDDD